MSGLALHASPNALVIRPASSGRIQFTLYDRQNLPVADQLLQFTIAPDPTQSGTTSAMLSTEKGLTDRNGNAVLEIIVGALDGQDRPAAFTLHATGQGKDQAAADTPILVTTNAYSVEILPVLADDVMTTTSGSVTTTRLQFYDSATCADLDLNNLGASATRPRAPHVVALGSTFVFTEVAAKGSSAVVGQGLDNNNIVRIAGCVDVPGASLLESTAIRVTLAMDHLFPVPVGNYQAVTSFQFKTPLSATVAIQSAWQQWARCPLDPARLWLDCTLDALSPDSSNDPDDCIPVAGTEGPLEASLVSRRGTTVAPLKGTVASATDTPCHDAKDSNGNTSLEAAIDNLFASATSRARLSNANLGGFAAEIATLLDSVRIDSQLTVTSAPETNRYFVEHALAGIAFPDAPFPNAFKVSSLALPVPTASLVLATLVAGQPADQFSLPRHGFTLRLGTTARYAFESSSLEARGAQNSSDMVNSLFGLAQLNDASGTLTGCDALDAVVCDQIKQPRGCVVAACLRGLVALANNLAGPFANLDGDGLDFFLSGSAPIIDLDGDGLVDALGIASSAGTVGSWTVELRTRTSTYLTSATWAAARIGALP